jgi:hypothetical protein
MWLPHVAVDRLRLGVGREHWLAAAYCLRAVLRSEI